VKADSRVTDGQNEMADDLATGGLV